MSADSFDYRMVKCSHCGSYSALELGICNRCGHELKGSNTAKMILLAFGGALFFIAVLSLLLYVTRGSDLGAILVIMVYALSAIVGLIGYIWLVVAAFQVGGMWGVACVFIPLAQLVFLYKYTDRAVIPFSLNLFSTVLILITVFGFS